jgi:hypothetical protein
MKAQLTKAELNHLRRLLGWVQCEIGQPPEEMLATIKNVVAPLGPFRYSEKMRLTAAYTKSQSIPKYVRAAVKSLERTVREHGGEILDAELARKALK